MPLRCRMRHRIFYSELAVVVVAVEAAAEAAEAVPTEDHLECRTAEVMEDFKRNAQPPEI